MNSTVERRIVENILRVNDTDWELCIILMVQYIKVILHLKNRCVFKMSLGLKIKVCVTLRKL